MYDSDSELCDEKCQQSGDDMLVMNCKHDCQRGVVDNITAAATDHKQSCKRQVSKGTNKKQLPTTSSVINLDSCPTYRTVSDDTQVVTHTVNLELLTVSEQKLNDQVVETNAFNDELLSIWSSVNSKKEKMVQAQQVEVFQQWCMQNEGAFGFIPLSPLIGENGHVDSPIEAFHRVRRSRLYNFQKEKITLTNQLNIPVLEDMLKNYWVWQEVQFLKFGFLLDVDPAVV